MQEFAVRFAAPLAHLDLLNGGVPFSDAVFVNADIDVINAYTDPVQRDQLKLAANRDSRRVVHAVTPTHLLNSVGPLKRRHPDQTLVQATLNGLVDGILQDPYFVFCFARDLPEHFGALQSLQDHVPDSDLLEFTRQAYLKINLQVLHRIFVQNFYDLENQEFKTARRKLVTALDNIGFSNEQIREIVVQFTAGMIPDFDQVKKYQELKTYWDEHIQIELKHILRVWFADQRNNGFHNNRLNTSELVYRYRFAKKMAQKTHQNPNEQFLVDFAVPDQNTFKAVLIELLISEILQYGNLITQNNDPTQKKRYEEFKMILASDIPWELPAWDDFCAMVSDGINNDTVKAMVWECACQQAIKDLLNEGVMPSALEVYVHLNRGKIIPKLISISAWAHGGGSNTIEQIKKFQDQFAKAFASEENLSESTQKLMRLIRENHEMAELNQWHQYVSAIAFAMKKTSDLYSINQAVEKGLLLRETLDRGQ